MKNHKSHPILPRAFALIIDLIILGISCTFLVKLIIAHTNLSPFVIHVMGCIYCLVYFVMLNSHIGSGKTIGKMLCRIRVTNATSQEIGIAQSFLRSAIFVLPLCFIGYIKPYAQFSLMWSIVQVILLSIVIACIYLAAFNTQSQQGLHDWLTRTQVLRNSQSSVKITPIWKGHFYILALITLALLITAIWQSSKRQNQDFSSLDPTVHNIQLITHHTYLGEAESLNQILSFDLNQRPTQNDLDTAQLLLEKLNHQEPGFIANNGIDKAQLNYADQFGLVRINHSVTFDIVENRGVITLIHSGQGTSMNLGF
ncbi:RDD family protein [Acinetobacter sp. 194]|uniref:RDD family protein n=1 Tax=Acinetobacter shaoyimingii TaxID=2715164 RepID=UPI001409A2BC|nr:RDD family protein [Acinetobacter shaoyimingii]NHB58367.1 RDD family protein [Acinetobacter shaoyimingii]